MINNRPQRMRKLAVLVDGDNAQPSLLPKILAEAAKHGTLTIRRIFGDWTTPQMNSWKEKLNTYAVQPVQQFRYTVGKNATDSAMIIDAMDILHSELVDGFCIVSSDSDYTRLATRIREEGIFVMGIGKKQTPKPFVNGCNLFIYTENIDVSTEVDEKQVEAPKKVVKNEKDDLNRAIKSLPLLREAYELGSDESDWVHLGNFGNNLRQIDPGFDPRTYGFKQLSQLVNALPRHFEMKIKESDAGPAVVYVKYKLVSRRS